MKLYELFEEFEDLVPEEKLELLMEFADELPPVSEERTAELRDPKCRVQECQTPVYLWVDMGEGGAHLEADVPEKSPTVRGLVSLLVEGLEGASPEEITSMPDDILLPLGLHETLGMTRQHGMRGLVARIKREIVMTGASSPSG